MAKVIKIETGAADGNIGGFGNQVARFTYDDGQASFIAVKAFPSTDEMIADMTTDANPFVQLVVSAGRGIDTGEAQAGATVTDWKQIYPQ